MDEIASILDDVYEDMQTQDLEAAAWKSEVDPRYGNPVSRAWSPPCLEPRPTQTFESPAENLRFGFEHGPGISSLVLFIFKQNCCVVLILPKYFLFVSSFELYLLFIFTL